MLTLSKTNNRGRKRLHPRVEELVAFDIRELVTNQPGGRHSVIDGSGNKIRFVPVMERTGMALVVFINDVRQGSYPIVERDIPGHISSKTDPNKMFFYYVVVDGRRYKRLYVDACRQMIGSREGLGAVYTCDSVGPKQVETWRAIRTASQRKARKRRN